MIAVLERIGDVEERENEMLDGRLAQRSDFEEVKLVATQCERTGDCGVGLRGRRASCDATNDLSF